MRGFIVGVLKQFLRHVEIPDPRLDAVRDLVVEVADKDVSGERKRSNVLNRLVAQFPDANKRDLAFMIEQVLQETK